jgi:hypothetical protein
MALDREIGGGERVLQLPVVEQHRAFRQQRLQMRLVAGEDRVEPGVGFLRAPGGTIHRRKPDHRIRRRLRALREGVEDLPRRCLVTAEDVEVRERHAGLGRLRQLDDLLEVRLGFLGPVERDGERRHCAMRRDVVRIERESFRELLLGLGPLLSRPVEVHQRQVGSRRSIVELHAFL